jgi:hypothetical protein
MFNGRGVIFNDTPNDSNENTKIYENFDNLRNNWIKYEGSFHKDSKDGLGTIYLSNGDKFFGLFRNDRANGKGIYFTSKEKFITGYWKDNVL